MRISINTQDRDQHCSILILVQAKEERSKPRCDVALNPTTIKMAEAEAVVYANSVKHSGDEEYKQIKVGDKLCHCLSCDTCT